MKIIRHTDPDYADAIRGFDRRAEASEAVREVVSGVIRAIRERGDEALLEFTERFDGAKLGTEDLLVSQDEMDAAWTVVGGQLDPAVAAGIADPSEMAEAGTPPASAGRTTRMLDALHASHRNVRDFALKSLRKNWMHDNEQGAQVGEVFHPFERVGCYVPGGTAPLVSTALMTVTLAAAAGVPEIVVCTPCDKEGKVNSGLLAALRIAGATEVYKVGGAQAIAAMAYGTRTIRPVTKIFGPGNSYVVEAKRQVFGAVAVDLLPGPSEVLILADNSAKPSFIAADVLAQAEHGKDSMAGFITDDETLLDAVLAEIDKQAATLSRQSMLRPVLEKGVFAVLTPTLEDGARLVNAFAPEHLTLITEREDVILPMIRTAGAIFLGNYSPVAVGDFLAGPSHTLPTGGAGKSFPGLTVDMFQRRTSIIRLDRESCTKSEPVTRIFSEIEGLDAHGNSVHIRTTA